MLTRTLLRALTGRMSRRERILLNAERRIDALWRATDPFDGKAVQRFSEQAAELTIAAQRQAVSLTTATQLQYWKEVNSPFDFVPEVPDDVRMFGKFESDFVKPKPVKVQGKRQERLPTAEIFNRPAREYRLRVSKGMDKAEALEISAKRAKLYMETNVALAEREATFQIMDEGSRKTPTFLGWRRVIHPEASTTGVCGLCLAASDRVYSLQTLKPMHDHCNCEVLPITEDNDPGDELNMQDLEKLYDRAGGTAAKHLGKVHYKEDEHGELGPVLVPPRKKYVVPTFTFQDQNDMDFQKPVDLDAAVPEAVSV